MSSQTTHKGEPTIVFCIDVGTTFTGGAYAVLLDGVPTKVLPIAPWPKASDARFATELYYAREECWTLLDKEKDDDTSRGSEKERIIYGMEKKSRFDEIEQGLADNSLLPARRHKLHFAPSYQLDDKEKIRRSTLERFALPEGKTKIDVHADWLHKLWDDISSFSTECILSLRGKTLKTTNIAIELLLTHPNGWDHRVQNEYKQACAQAKIPSKVKISFVSEGEACMYYITKELSASMQLLKDDNVVVVDGGGGTIDISTYVIKSDSDQQLQVSEIHEAVCDYGGATRIDDEVASTVRSILKDKDWATEGHFTSALEDWLQVKLHWNGNRVVRLRLSTDCPGAWQSDLNEHGDGVSMGKIVLSVKSVQSFFSILSSTTIERIADICKQEAFANSTNGTVKIFMTGGLAQAACYRKQVEEGLGGVPNCTVDVFSAPSGTEKVVAMGGAHYAISKLVARPIVHSYISPMHYGIMSTTIFDEQKHRTREDEKFLGLDLVARVPGVFSAIIKKGDMGDSQQGKSEMYKWEKLLFANDLQLSTTLYACKNDVYPEFVLGPAGVQSNEYIKMARWEFTVENLSSDPILRSAIQDHTNNDGVEYQTMIIEWEFKLFGPQLSAELFFLYAGGRKSVQTCDVHLDFDI